MSQAPMESNSGRSLDRIPALDGIRACAIILVVMCHVQVFLHPLSGHLASFCINVAWCGVYLFFVLSGYLIGRLAQAEIASTGDLKIKAFWARRALRTWPMYFLALFGNYWLVPHQAAPAPGLWSYMTFTQTFFHMNYFIESWTLSVEELFYLALPIILFCVIRLRARRWLGIVCLAIMSLSYLVRYRTGYWLHPATTFDSLFMGVLIARLEMSHNRYFGILRNASRLTLLAGLSILVVLFLFTGAPMIKQFQGVLAIGFGLILVAALNPTAIAAKLLSTKVLKIIALSSYSTYLSHMFFMRALVSAHLDNSTPATLMARGLFVLASTATLVFGWLVYIVLEKPGLRLREVIVPRRATAVSSSESGSSAIRVEASELATPAPAIIGPQ